MSFNLNESIIYEDNNLLIVNKPRGLLLQQDGDDNHESLDKYVSDYFLMIIDFNSQENPHQLETEFQRLM